MTLPVADAHVDVLMRMSEEGAPFAGDSPLAASLERLQMGHVTTQVFALFVWPRLPETVQLEKVLQGIDLFYTEVAATGRVQPVKSKQEYQAAAASGKIAGLLSIEGAGCLRAQPHLLRVMYQLGVRGMGLTWNDANALADGCGEPRNGGLTTAGRRIVQEMQHLGMWIDLAHLGDHGVRDVLDLVDGPVMASHANARKVHAHRRNLPDEVIREIVRRQGWIGITFEGSFLNHPAAASLDDVFRHLDHFLELGADDCLGFGSDFDGTSNAVPNLSSAADYARLSEALVKRYGEGLAHKLCHQNFERFLLKVLP
ncbi:dipeptidase [Alicyclobacillus cycloheptanicus]|uniref:Membrane dipeptidase n=1 Tax=Alicyclobacillus cycloheptanicus TaxID=1457 RepID=A0ABT9XHX0_9BACL|nr:dipeptidase [Alicyclobacillus cycloheptanicus]MDQ0189301.1 membrane dipeptidase [Alicyclobacillus cycloheptanicus]